MAATQSLPPGRQKSSMTFDITIMPYKGVAPSEFDRLVHDLALLGVHAQLGAELELPAGAYNPRRRQYRADAFLQQTRSTGGGGPILAVTDCDLYADGLNFVFGLADSAGRAAVISLRRLRWHADETRFRARAVKEAIHELGHTLGLGHCPDPECVMHFSNSLADTDRKGQTPCPRCRARGLLSA